MPDDPDSAAIEALRLIGPDPPDWVPERLEPDGKPIDCNVVIVGGGQSGCALAFALRRAGIGRVLVIDAAADGEAAGIWRGTARMTVLRTAKTLPGPELGIPALGFRAWYEARHGRAAYDAMVRIPRTDWADYLAWYRRFLGIPVRYATRLARIEPAGGHFRLHLDGAGSVTARKVILATGFAGNGGPYLPPAVAALPPSLRAHTAEAIDFARLRGKRVAVVGAAASAFDAAAVALERGAARVHLFARREAISAVPVARVRGYAGAYDNYPALPDRIRWHQAIRFRRAGSNPPADAIERVMRFPQFRLHLAAPWLAAREADGGIAATAADGEHRFDFVIAGTGYRMDLAAVPELADIAGDIRLWRDQFTPPPGEEDEFLAAHPYLGDGHEFLEKRPGTAPFLADIHIQNPAGFVSHGVPAGDVPSMKRGIPAIAARISRDLFLADLDRHEARLLKRPGPEFDPDLYAAAIWRRGEVTAPSGRPHRRSAQAQPREEG